MVLLNIENLSVSCSNHKILNEINFSLDKGECVGLVGESGSGKSVTAQAIMQLLDKAMHIDSGKILFEGENLLEKNEKQMQDVRGKKIGMIFQDPLTALNPTMKVGKQIMEILLKHEKIDRQTAREFAIALLTQMGISEPETRFHSYPFQLSGGMRQRVMIAIAIACRPQLLISDESTTALDVTVQAQILQQLRSLQQNYQMGLLLITHDLGIVAGICDKVIVMRSGSIVENGSTDQIFYAPTNNYTKTLLQAAGAST